MLAVFKRELASYFHTMTGYIFMAFLFVVVGIYFSAYNLSYQYSLFGYALALSLIHISFSGKQVEVAVEEIKK